MDINADLGEWYGKRDLNVERSIMPFLTSCNIACGFHSGDPFTIEQTIKIALENGVKIGAHPSFPDRQGFGRRVMQMPIDELKALIRYQVAALKGMVEALGGQLHHVKPHGALYNHAMKDETTAFGIVEAIRSISEELIIYGLPNSKVEQAASHFKMPFWKEGFADRAYENDLSLRSRSLEGAVLHDFNTIKKQVDLFKKGQVDTYHQELMSLEVQTICIHSDTQNAVKIAQLVHSIVQS